MAEKEHKRKCFKCGSSPAEDGVRLFRFTKPGTMNLLRCELWAKYIFPEGDYSSLQFQRKLYDEHRVLCEKHFKVEDFSDESKTRLVRNAVPYDSPPPTTCKRRLEQAPLDSPSDHSGEFSSTTSEELRKKPKLAQTEPSEGQVHDNGETTFTQTPEAEYDETLFESHDLTTELESYDLTTELEEEETIAPKQETPKQEHIFSWQKGDAVVPCDTGEGIEKKGEEVKEDEEQISETLELDWHLNIQCNICKNDIHGFRYVCVQCPDYDLCSTCEARRAHSAHYVLRVPGPRPESELQQVLRAIRQALAASILQLDTEAPVEVKEEEEDPLIEAPAAGPPDGSADELQTDEEYEDAQYLSDDESVCCSTEERPPEKLEETEPETTETSTPDLQKPEIVKLQDLPKEMNTVSITTATTNIPQAIRTYSSTAPSLTQILCISKNAMIRLNRDSVLRKPIAKAQIQKPIILKKSKRFEDLQRRLVKPPPQAQIQSVQITQDRVETLQKSAEKRTYMPGHGQSLSTTTHMPAKASPAKIRILNTSTAFSTKAEPNQKEPKAVLRKVVNPIDTKFNLKAYVPVPRLPTITVLNTDKDNTNKS